MRRVCLACTRSAPDDNLLCQERYCPAERAPHLLDPGEWLGDIEVVRVLSVLRSAALYEATQRGRAVLLKVAHPAPQAVERLKREAWLLAALADAHQHPDGIPRLLPPYVATTIQTNPYGRAALNGHLLFFCIWQAFPGTPLPDILAERPQLWVYQVGWLVSAVTRCVTLLQSRDLLHYALCPQAILVRFETGTDVPRVLLADFGLAAIRPELAQHWDAELIPPSYTAPDLIDGTPPPASYAIDVYGLGLLLHELLAGAPAFPRGLGSDDEILARIRQPQVLRTGRTDDVQGLAKLAERATSYDQAARPRNAAEFLDQLQAAIGKVPAPKHNWLPNPRSLLITVAALLALAFVLICVANTGIL